jgi:hypothetical protein
MAPEVSPPSVAARDRWISRRRFLALFALLVGIRVAVVPIALASDGTVPRRHAILPGDARRYHNIAEHAGRPYRDFAVEYPPLMLAAIEAVNGPTVRSTTVRLMWSQLVVDIAIVLVVSWAWGRRAGIAYLVISLPFLVYPFIYLRLDLLSVFLAVLGIALVERRHPYAGGASLAAACLAKLWPLLIVPVLLVRRSWRAFAVFSALFVFGILGWLVYGGIDGLVQVLTFRGAKGWEIESTVGALVRSIGGLPVHVEHGALRVGTVAAWSRDVLGLALAGAVALTWFAAARAKPVTPGVLDGLAPLTAVVAFLVISPLLSPQFVCWMIPFAAVVAIHGERLVTRLTFAVVCLSVAQLAFIQRLARGDGLPIAVLAVRNALLIGLLAVLAVRLAQLARSSRPVSAGTDLAPVEAAYAGVLGTETTTPPLSVDSAASQLRDR